MVKFVEYRDMSDEALVQQVMYIDADISDGDPTADERASQIHDAAIKRWGTEAMEGLANHVLACRMTPEEEIEWVDRDWHSVLRVIREGSPLA